MPVDSINVKGHLVLFNTETKRNVRLFTSANESEIARVACNELGFGDYNWVTARPVDDLNKRQNLNGLECFGYERSIKECHLNGKTLNQHELEIECLGEKKV
jgi:hypothetical protein